MATGNVEIGAGFETVESVHTSHCGAFVRARETKARCERKVRHDSVVDYTVCPTLRLRSQ